MIIRYRDSIGEYLLRDPEVTEGTKGPYFAAFYSVIHNGQVRPVQYGGHFALMDAMLIEPWDEQMALAA